MSILGRFTYSGAAQSVAANGNITLNGDTDTCGVSCDGQTVTISKPGNYVVFAQAVMQATAAGTLGIALYRDGNQAAGAQALATAAAVGDYATGSVATLLTCPRCGHVSVNLRSLYAEDVVSASVVVERV